MSLFKRKGRRVSALEDEEAGGALDADPSDTPGTPVAAPVRFGKRPNKQSALRRSINIHDDEADDSGDGSRKGSREASQTREEPGEAAGEEEDGPAVVRPSLSRSGSTRAKKRVSSSSRLSFGVSADDESAQDRPAGAGTGAVSTPRRTGGVPSLGQRVLETNAFRRSLTGRLPTRPLDPDDDADRPRYSQADLEELQSATLSTPPPQRQKPEPDADEMELDVSELEGAMVVDAAELDLAAENRSRGRELASSLAAPAAHVLTETEIQERKDRRARRALEQEAASLVLGSDDDEEKGYISLSLRDNKKEKTGSRLVREDEDLGEGFDEFVEDGGLSLGRKAEREARRRRKQEMAELIQEAQSRQGVDEDGRVNITTTATTTTAAAAAAADSDDSEAERRAAYDAAQVRAGMDGMRHRRRRHGHDLDDDEDEDDDMTLLNGSGSSSRLIPKMLPLPDLDDCLARMQRVVQGLEEEARLRQTKLAEVEAERAEIVAREAEVQKILDEAGRKYTALLGKKPPEDSAAALSLSATASPLRGLPPAERGLESLGGTPVRKTDDGGPF